MSMGRVGLTTARNLHDVGYLCKSHFRGLYPPASAWTSTLPSALMIRRRVDSGRYALSRPVYWTSQRATISLMTVTVLSTPDVSIPAMTDPEERHHAWKSFTSFV